MLWSLSCSTRSMVRCATMAPTGSGAPGPTDPVSLWGNGSGVVAMRTLTLSRP